jgi:nucleoside-diphosphate-sugar epimerase
VRRFDKVSGNTFNLATGNGERLRDLATWIIRETGSDSRIEIDHKRTGEISRFVADISQARKLLGYNPKVSLKEGVTLAVEWYLRVIKERRIYDLQRRALARWGWQ